MPSYLVSRLDLDKLYPDFLEKLLYVLADLKAEKLEFWATLGFRTFEEQDALFEAGKSAAKGGYSAHNYGLAVDLCLDFDPSKPGLQPDYSNVAAYAELGKVAKLHGLVWGGDWAHPDRDHIQWPHFVTASELEPLKDRLAAGDLRSVWKLVDSCQA